MKEYLSDKEVEKIEAFFKDKVALEAVKKVVLESVYGLGTLKKDKPASALKNWALVIAQQGLEWGHTTSQVGERLQAVSEGVQRVESGFGELANIKKEVKAVKTSKDNPAL